MYCIAQIISIDATTKFTPTDSHSLRPAEFGIVATIGAWRRRMCCWAPYGASVNNWSSCKRAMPLFQKIPKNPKKIQKKNEKYQKSIKKTLKNQKNVKNGQKSENLKKSQKFQKKSLFFKKKCLFWNKNFAGKNKMLSSQFSNIRRTRFDHSFPVHPVSDFRGGTLSVTEEDKGRTDGRRKSSCLMLDIQAQRHIWVRVQWITLGQA